MTHLNSAPAYLVRGQVMHERLRPVKHRFVYPVFYVRLNLARLNEIKSCWFGFNKTRLVSFFNSDHGPKNGSDLQVWIRNLLKNEGINADGEIWLQTFPRVFGFVFNPVSFWYCYDKSNELRAVLAEVNNTFGETHCYLLVAPNHQPISEQMELECKKNLHVSPFCPVRGNYRFRFRETKSATWVRLNYLDEKGLLLKTVLGGKRIAMTSAQLVRAMLMQPLLTFGIIFRIHWQAFKLWMKRVPYFSKPAPPNHAMTHSITLPALLTSSSEEDEQS